MYPHPKTSRIALAALALGISTVASAGFVDEQSLPGPARSAGRQALAQAMSHSGVGAHSVSGGFLTPEWLAALSSGASDVTLATALMQILPAGSPPVGLSPSKPSLLDLKVSYSAGEPRLLVLRRASAQHGLLLRLDMASRQIIISEMPDQALQQVAAAPTPALSPRAPATAVAPKAVAPTVAGAVARMESPAAATPAKRFDLKTSDVNLARAFDRWAHDNGVRIRWDADRHVLVGAPMVYEHRDVFEAVADVLSSPSIRFSEYPLEVCEYPNVPRLLRITRQGDQARECAGGEKVAVAR